MVLRSFKWYPGSYLNALSLFRKANVLIVMPHRGCVVAHGTDNDIGARAMIQLLARRTDDRHDGLTTTAAECSECKAAIPSGPTPTGTFGGVMVFVADAFSYWDHDLLMLQLSQGFFKNRKSLLLLSLFGFSFSGGFWIVSGISYNVSRTLTVSRKRWALTLVASYPVSIRAKSHPLQRCGAAISYFLIHAQARSADRTA
jgi:hypothetical protein